ncbi:MAG TPA: glycosyltransferase family 39 protein [Phycisphaerales bacterium]|nr:glycosyltransferase family 39 protein [Phycisphaerales bacterium]
MNADPSVAEFPVGAAFGQNHQGGEIHAKLITAGILLIALVIAVVGGGRALPVDSHEVFVARTAEEMIARHSWIVPWMNDEPRLKKPPLSYWTVMAVDRINGGDGVVQVWEARLPSVIGGLLLAAGTLCLGRRAFGETIGVLAALMLVTSGAYISMTHNARPEMLYAGLCMMGFVCFYRAWQSAETQATSSKLFSIAHLGWLFMGLAMLAKGPQLPIPIILGWVIGLAICGKRKTILPSLRPISGVLIAAAVSVWWFVLVERMVPQAASVWSGETSNRYFADDEPKARWLDPYYLYQTAKLMLPWVIPYGLAVLAPWLKELKSTPQAKALWVIAVTCGAVLHISLGRRDYYMLPVTGIVAVIMAAASVKVLETLVAHGKSGLAKLLALLHTLIFAGIIIERRINLDSLIQPSILGIVIVCVAAALVIVLILSQRSISIASSCALLPMLAAVVFSVTAENTRSLWDVERVTRLQFCDQLAPLIAPDTKLIGWQDRWEVDQYYFHRTIPSYDNEKDLRTALDQQVPCLLLTTNDEDRSYAAPNLGSKYQHEVLLRTETQTRPIELWRVTRSGKSD